MSSLREMKVRERSLVEGDLVPHALNPWRLAGLWVVVHNIGSENLIDQSLRCVDVPGLAILFDDPANVLTHH